jgi:hypothetical protein
MRRHGLSSFLIFIIWLAILAPATTLAQDSTSSSVTERPPKRKLIVKQGIGNFGEITPEIYRGAQPNLVGYRELARMGVKIVVDLRLTGKDEENREVRKLGMQFVSIPWHCYFPKDKYFARFLELLRENRGKKIAAYRMAVEGWTPKEAREEMEQYGFHHLVCPSLGPYEKDFPEHLKKNAEFRTLRSKASVGNSQ